MHALIVPAHPDPSSLVHGVAAAVVKGVLLSGAESTAEVADLATEGFDPRFTMADIAVHRRERPAPRDVASEQARIDRAHALVLVYPVYWWSMPGLLKAWIDRVFSNGWAYDETSELGLVKRLARLQVHLVGIGGADRGTYERHGYAAAMTTQIDHGIFDYCGAYVATSALLLNSASSPPGSHVDAGRAIGRSVVQCLGERECAAA